MYKAKNNLKNQNSKLISGTKHIQKYQDRMGNLPSDNFPQENAFMVEIGEDMLSLDEKELRKCSEEMG